MAWENNFVVACLVYEVFLWLVLMAFGKEYTLGTNTAMSSGILSDVISRSRSSFPAWQSGMKCHGKMIFFGRFGEHRAGTCHLITHQMAVKLFPGEFQLSLKFGSEELCEGKDEARTKRVHVEYWI